MVPLAAAVGVRVRFPFPNLSQTKRCQAVVLADEFLVFRTERDRHPVREEGPSVRESS